MADSNNSAKQSPAKKRKNKTKWRPINDLPVETKPKIPGEVEPQKSAAAKSKDKPKQAASAGPLTHSAWSSGQVPSKILANAQPLQENADNWPALGIKSQAAAAKADLPAKQGKSLPQVSGKEVIDKPSANAPSTAPQTEKPHQNPAATNTKPKEASYDEESDPQQQGSLVQLSKTLSYVLRHGAGGLGLEFTKGGFLYVDDLLKLKQLQNYTLNNIIDVVEKNDKQRFHIERDPTTKQLMICANQGHSVEVEGLELTPITDGSQYAFAIHGTYMKNWEQIKTEGLKRMGRNHIHIACGEPGRDKVISGMRSTCDVIIKVDISKAMADGIPFYISRNQVILSPGDEHGLLLPKYFKRVIDRKTREELEF